MHNTRVTQHAKNKFQNHEQLAVNYAPHKDAKTKKNEQVICPKFRQE